MNRRLRIKLVLKALVIRWAICRSTSWEAMIFF